MQIFMVQGMVIGVIGTLVGVAARHRASPSTSTSSCRRSRRVLGFKFLVEGRLPTSPSCRPTCSRRDVIAIALVALALSFVATLYPSWRAARVNPAEALRYE